MASTINALARMGAFHNGDPDEAKFFWSGDPVEVADRAWFASTFAGVTAFDTDAGLVVVDTSTAVAAPTIAAGLRRQSSAPVHTAIYTHGHVDHAYGLKPYLVPDQAPPRVIAHRAAAHRFTRYVRTSAYNTAINIRQFGGAVPEHGSLGGVVFSEPAVPPNTYYDDELSITVGGLSFELHHARGETDDATWVWCPERRVLCPGDLFIWAVPNCGNPQKVQRYPWDWAVALRAMAACEPRSLCPGHGGPVVNDPAKIQRMLLETADYLEYIVTQTLDALNDGAPPHVDILHRVQIPSSDAPWLQPIYDEGEFIVRNLIRYFGGWWSGRPSELKPAARRALAGEIVALAGGPAALVSRAQQQAQQGDLRVACHLADFALEAAPADPAVQEAVAAIYEQRAKSETSLMAANLFASAAAYARAGRPFR